MNLRTADFDLGFFLISLFEGFLFLYLPSLNIGTFSQIHIASFGSHVHPFVSLSINCFTVRSSIEWYERKTIMPFDLIKFFTVSRDSIISLISLFTSILTAWNIFLTVLLVNFGFCRGRDDSMTLTNSFVVWIGLLLTIVSAIFFELLSSAYS